MFQQDADYLSLCALQIASPRIQNMCTGTKKCRLEQSSRHQYAGNQPSLHLCAASSLELKRRIKAISLRSTRQLHVVSIQDAEPIEVVPTPGLGLSTEM